MTASSPDPGRPARGRALLPLAAAGLALAALAVWLAGDRGDERPAAAAPRGDEHAAPSARTVPIAPEQAPPAERRSEREVLEDSAPETAPATAPEVVVGTVLVARAGGTPEPFHGDGVLDWMALGSADPATGRVAVEDGRWTWPVARSGLWIERAVLEGEEHTPLEALVLKSAPHVVVRAPLALAVEVVDAETGAPLDGFEVRFDRTPSEWNLLERNQREARDSSVRPHFQFPIELGGRSLTAPTPGATVLARDVSSPVTLDPVRSFGTYWFTAEGHEWRPWPETFTGGAEPRVELLRADDWTVVLACLPEPTAELYLHASGEGRVRAELPLEPGRLRYVLPKCARRWSKVVLSDRGPWGEYRVLASAVLEVDGPAVTSFGCPPGEVPRATLFATILVDGEVELERAIVGDTSYQVRPTASGDFELGPVELTPGRQVVSLPQIGLRRSLELLSGTNTAVIEVEGLRDRRLVVIDRATAEPVAVRRVDVASRGAYLPSYASAALQVGVPADAAFDPIPIVLPAGAVTISIHTLDDGNHRIDADVFPGQEEVLLRIAPRCAVEVVLRVDGNEVRYTPDWLAGFRAVGPAGEPLACSAQLVEKNGEMRGLLWIEGAGPAVLTAPHAPWDPAPLTGVAELVPGEEARVVLEAKTP